MYTTGTVGAVHSSYIVSSTVTLLYISREMKINVDKVTNTMIKCTYWCVDMEKSHSRNVCSSCSLWLLLHTYDTTFVTSCRPIPAPKLVNPAIPIRFCDVIEESGSVITPSPFQEKLGQHPELVSLSECGIENEDRLACHSNWGCGDLLCVELEWYG